MLNYVWAALIFMGLGAAIYYDISDSSSNKYKNKLSISAEFLSEAEIIPDKKSPVEGKLKIEKETFNSFYSENIDQTVIVNAKITPIDKNEATLYIKIPENAPKIWKEMAKVNGEKDDLIGKIKFVSIDNSTKQTKLLVTFEDIGFNKMKTVTNGLLDMVNTAVQIALGLIGVMALWLGIMKIAEEAGLIKIIARAMRPFTKFLFPDVPQDHPAMGSMIMNISANMLGLSNAATPFGLKAMEELNSLNPKKDTASNAMCTFLAINTAGLTFIPATAIAVRAAAGSSDPAIIIGTSVFGASCATIMGVTSAKILEKFPIPKGEFSNWWKQNKKSFITIFSVLLVFLLVVLSGVAKFIGSFFSFISPELFRSVIGFIAVLAIPTLIFSFIVYGFIKRVKVYEKFIEGAKEGFNVAVRIIPYLVGMLAAISIFRNGGAMDILVNVLNPLTSLVGMPAEVLPMALMRPLSGSGSIGIMAEIIKIYGPDSLIGIMASTFYGSSETTFYVLAVYFGSVNINKTRHALPVGLIADICGTLGAVYICNMLFR